MTVTGDTMIFKNDLGFSTTISNKNMDGTWENMYISVQFPKNDERAKEMDNKTKIYIKNGFLSFYKSTAGISKVKLIITDYEIRETEKTMQSNNDPFDDMVTSVDDYSDEDLPFWWNMKGEKYGSKENVW